MKSVLMALAILACAAMVFAQTPVVAQGGVLNAASFALNQGVAPGSLVSIFGTNLAANLAQADTIPLSTSLGNVTVTFNNLPAPLLFVNHDPVNGDQINAQLPYEVPTGSGQVVVNRGGVASAPANVNVISAAPGIFAVNFGVGQAIAYGNSDGQFAAPVGSIPGLTTHPAKIGDPTTLVILATGLGAVTPPVTTGSAVTDGQIHYTVVNPTVLVGGVETQLIFSGLQPQFPGVYQLNIIIAPGTPTGDAIPLQLVMDGITTTNQVTIAVTD
ncbi:MAG TPA: hypothetical protein VIN93_13890 [Bryobacteraceae bacterium]|jgi:uncharacterized protein (TIGR03437 family)